MGGTDGYGTVEPEVNEPVFHHRWEGRVLSMTRGMAAGGAFKIDASRFYREILAPEVYLTSSYYEKWLFGLENLLVAKGYLTADELSEGHASGTPKPLTNGKFTTDQVERVLPRGTFSRPAPAPALFNTGDHVRAKNIHPLTHTRLPRYVRSHVGVVERIHGCHVFPDAVAHDK